MASTSRLNIDINATDNASDKVEGVNKSLAGMKAAVGAAATAISAKLTGALVDAGKEMVNLFHTQERAEATLKQATGDMAEHWKQFAGEIQNTSIFGDEDVIQNSILPIQNFFRDSPELVGILTQASADFASAFDEDLGSVSKNFAKYVDQGSAGFNRLEKLGVNISDELRSQVEMLEEQGEHDEARLAIAKDIASQYEGQAEAIANTNFGAWTQFSNLLGDMKEQFGKIISENLQPIINLLKGVVNWVMNLSDGWKTTIVWVGMAIVVLGGIVTAIIAIKSAMLLLTVVMGGFSASMVVATGGLILLVAAVIAGIFLLAKNWDWVIVGMMHGWLSLKKVVKGILDGIASYLNTLIRAANLLNPFKDIPEVKFTAGWDEDFERDQKAIDKRVADIRKKEDEERKRKAKEKADIEAAERESDRIKKEAQQGGGKEGKPVVDSEVQQAVDAAKAGRATTTTTTTTTPARTTTTATRTPTSVSLGGVISPLKAILAVNEKGNMILEEILNTLYDAGGETGGGYQQFQRGGAVELAN